MQFRYSKFRGRLFTKYVALFAAVVCVALLTSGLSEIWFFYQDHKASLIRIQREQAEGASAKIGQSITLYFIKRDATGTIVGKLAVTRTVTGSTLDLGVVQLIK